MSTVTLRAAGSPQTVVAEQLGDDSLTGGVGGWEQMPRPHRSTATAWTGTPALVWELQLNLDGGPTDLSIERQCTRLESWGRPGKDDDEPPALVVTAPAGRAPATARWVIDAIVWGEQTRNDAGDRIQQEVSLTLLEYVPGPVLKGPAAKARNGKKHKWVPISAKDRRCRQCKKPRGNKVHNNRGGK